MSIKLKKLEILSMNVLWVMNIITVLTRRIMTTFEDYITTTVTAVSAAVAFTVLINEAISGIYALNAAMLDEVKQQQVAQRR